MVIQQVVHQAPAVLRNGIKFAPTMLTQRALQLILNQFFRKEIQSGQLDVLQHKTMRVAVPDLGLSFQATLADNPASGTSKFPFPELTTFLPKRLFSAGSPGSFSTHSSDRPSEMKRTDKRLRVSMIKDSEPAADVSFTGNMDDLYLIATQRTDPDTLFFQRRLKITGDTELGLALKNLLDTIELSERLPQFMHQWTEQFADELERQSYEKGV